MTDESIFDHLSAMVAVGLAMDLDRVKPEPPCRICRPDDPCWLHRNYFNQSKGDGE